MRTLRSNPESRQPRNQQLGENEIGSFLFVSWQFLLPEFTCDYMQSMGILRGDSPMNLSGSTSITSYIQ